ncbi:hypothetical protein O181_070087 [Austropuccinia psidii MF-1]|uniref:Integrase catalytic domain-containing protein n=1 Tax=Austropuccinia psidii MF-1 TaxID=1389203 RepID=A0A9Q3F5A9_9BASI|nr:hypothetical protein [Austropuccinia psidii MF-1]
MNFITQLPLSNKFFSILVVVERFSKMAIFIPAYGTITSLDLAQIFINHVLSKHDLPASIVSDRGSLFVSSFWTQLCQKLKRSRDLSTAFHPETDGQIERVNQILEQYLRRNPSFYSIHISQDSSAGKLSKKLKPVQQVVKEELESEISRFKKNIKTTRPTKKLSERWLRPFEALKKIGSHEYHLKLPQQWKSVHPVFHVSLLEPVKQSTIPNLYQLPPPQAIVKEQEEWEVAQALHSKLKRGKLWYLVEWKVFSEDTEITA